jgi:protein-histidine pros-kinase
MNLRIKFNLVIITCCALSFIFIYINFKNKVNSNNQQEIENKAAFILDFSNKLDHSELNPEQSVFFTEELLSELEFENIKYLMAFDVAKNARFQAKIWQQEIIDSFVSNSSTNVFKGMKSDEKGEFQILSQSIKDPDKAVIGAKFIVIYKKEFLENVNNDLNHFIIILAVIFILLLIVINVLIQILIIRPIKAIASQANDISRGNKVVDELSVSGKDEISQLSHSFNRIIRSLKAAMKLINN